jgi:2-polyprenyl-3-methyl-5-hydroxy-6-metoxy-1,4-benzoquinol methylase
MDKSAFFARVQRERRLVDKDQFLLERCRGRDVLDVGCVGQDIDYADPNWLHARIAGVSKRLDGVDINAAGVAAVRARGFSMFTPDELRASGQRYDAIVMADVIEHVDNPVAFLEFYSGFLRDGGEIIVTTPNPFAAAQALRVLRFNTISVNREHTMWIDPKTFAEIARRSGCEIDDFAWLGDYGAVATPSVDQRVINTLARALVSLRRYYAPNYLVVLKPAGDLRS